MCSPSYLLPFLLRSHFAFDLLGELILDDLPSFVVKVLDHVKERRLLRVRNILEVFRQLMVCKACFFVFVLLFFLKCHNFTEGSHFRTLGFERDHSHERQLIETAKNTRLKFFLSLPITVILF